MKKISFTLIVFAASGLFSQEKKEYRFEVSYVAASTVYIAAGSDQEIGVGDTLAIVHDSASIGRVAVTAVARRTSIAQILVQQRPFAVGDNAVIVKAVIQPSNGTAAAIKKDTARSQEPAASASIQKIYPAENIVSGRIALQLNELVAADSKYNLTQPAVLFRFGIHNLFGAGLQFSVDDRSYYDPTNSYTQFGNSAGSEHRLTEFALQQDRLDAPVGFGIGRMSSRFVGGMGTFDGFQFFYRQSGFTAGALGGAQINDPVSVLSNTGTKGALFVNYRTSDDLFHYYDGTLAYGRQMVNNKLDREFVYLQNSFAASSDLSFYQNSDIELDKLTTGRIAPAVNLSNMNVSATYFPVEWFSGEVGYDAARPVYLFQTMKSIPDSLFQMDLSEGYRAMATFHLPLSVTLSEYATYRPKLSAVRDAHTLTTSLRIVDIFGSGIEPGIRYSSLIGEFSSGDDIAVDVYSNFFSNLEGTLRYEYARASIGLLQQTYITKTISASMYWVISQTWYASATLDDVIDTTLGDYQGLLELGIRF